MRKIAPGIVCFVVVLSLQLLPQESKAQVTTTPQDSILVLSPEADSAAQEKRFFLSGFKNLGRPGRAAVFSAIIPGAGQVYNGAWWKVPIIYATGGVLGYFLIDNNKQYQDFRVALNQRNSGQPDKYADDPIYGTQSSVGTRNLRLGRDNYRRNRDFTIMLSVLAYGLNIAEAYVHGHLREFDVGDNLSMRVQPDLFRTPAQNSMTPGLTLTLYPRTK